MLPSWNHENCCKHLVYAALSFVAEKQLHLVLKWTTMEFNGKKSLLKSNNSGKKSMIMKLEVTHFRMKVQQTFTQWKFVNWDSGLQTTSLIKFSRLEFKRPFFCCARVSSAQAHGIYSPACCRVHGEKSEEIGEMRITSSRMRKRSGIKWLSQFLLKLQNWQKKFMGSIVTNEYGVGWKAKQSQRI